MRGRAKGKQGGVTGEWEKTEREDETVTKTERNNGIKRECERRQREEGGREGDTD